MQVINTFLCILSYRYPILLVALYVMSVEARIHRLQCKTYADFSTSKINVALQGSVLETIMYINPNDCKERCIKNSKCMSINYFGAPGWNRCELNNATIYDDRNMDRLIPKYGWKFSTTNYNNHLIGDVCQKLKPCSKYDLCIDTCECPGFKCQKCYSSDEFQCTTRNLWPDCESLHRAGELISGVYMLSQGRSSSNSFKVYCDMETDDHGWAVIQRRANNRTDFDRLWNDYKQGFGNLSDNFWLGLDKIHALTNNSRSMLRVELQTARYSNMRLHAEYKHFKVGNESTNYLLDVGGFNARKSSLPDGLTNQFWYGRVNHNKRMFSTKDRENDPEPNSNCAEVYTGGWWFSECFLSHLNGLYYEPSVPINCMDVPNSGKYMTWYEASECFGGIILSEMKIRKL